MAKHPKKHKEEDPYRVKLRGVVRQERLPVFTIFKSTAFLKSGGLLGGRNANRPKAAGRFWRNAHRPAAFVAGSNKTYGRQVIVKVRSHNHATPTKTARERGPGVLKAHVNYLLRTLKAQGGESPIGLYNGSEENIDFKNTQHIWGNEKRHFRIVLSPQDGKELDLQRYARDLMGHMEADLGTKLEWVAANHYDTDNPHVHIVIRGKDDQGRDLLIPPDYITHGIRNRAETIVQQELGPLTLVELQQRLAKSRKTDRVNKLDYELEELQQKNGLVNILGEKYDRSIAVKERLHHLSTLGLAEESSFGIWRVNNNLVKSIREVVEFKQIEKTVNDTFQQPRGWVKFDKDSTKVDAIYGVIRGKGVSDDTMDRGHLLVDGVDGKVHFVPMFVNEAYMKYRAGDHIKLFVIKPPPISAPSDNNFSTFAEKGDRFYNRSDFINFVKDKKKLPNDITPYEYADAHEKRLITLLARGIVQRDESDTLKRVVIPKDLLGRIEAYQQSLKSLPKNRQGIQVIDSEPVQQQIKARGVTFLDRILIDKAPGIVNINFGAEVIVALEERKKFLLAHGLAVKHHEGIRVDRESLKKLKKMELHDYAQKMISSHTEVVVLREGGKFIGKASRVKEMRSGKFIEVVRNTEDNTRKMMLVPFRPQYDKLIGKYISLTCVNYERQLYEVKSHSLKQAKTPKP